MKFSINKDSCNLKKSTSLIKAKIGEKNLDLFTYTSINL